MKQKSKLSFVIPLTFLFSFYGKSFVFNVLGLQVDQKWVSLVMTYLWWILPTLFVLKALKIEPLFNSIGFSSKWKNPLLFSLVCVSPMFLGSWFLGKMAPSPDIFELFRGSALPGVFEEWLFRGFLFGILFRKAGWGFILASLLGSLLFGFAHVYQGSGWLQTSLIFLVTGMGAVWFAWLFVEWEYNLWVPIFLHAFMNLSWILFEVSENALGGLGANVFRVMTIALTVILTIRHGKQNGFHVNRSNLIVNKHVQ